MVDPFNTGSQTSLNKPKDPSLNVPIPSLRTRLPDSQKALLEKALMKGGEDRPKSRRRYRRADTTPVYINRDDEELDEDFMVRAHEDSSTHTFSTTRTKHHSSRMEASQMRRAESFVSMVAESDIERKAITVGRRTGRVDIILG